jgi:hypothetical protein
MCKLEGGSVCVRQAVQHMQLPCGSNSLQGTAVTFASTQVA